MDCREIEQLLERYWESETSLEEEKALRAFFSKDDIPVHLKRYRDLFLYQSEQQFVGLDDDFDRRVLARVEPVVVKAKRLTWMNRCFPLLKAAAVIVLFLSFGNVVQHFNVGAEDGILLADTIGKQVSAPSVAISDEGRVEKVLADSLNEVERQLLQK